MLPLAIEVDLARQAASGLSLTSLAGFAQGDSHDQLAPEGVRYASLPLMVGLMSGDVESCL